MRVERRGRCSVVSHTSLDNLMEKVVVQETCIAEDHKFFKAAQPKSYESKPLDAQVATPATTLALVAVARNCYGSDQSGHILKDCPRRGNVAFPPPPSKRLAIAPRVFAVGNPQGAEPTADMYLYHTRLCLSILVSWLSCVVSQISG
ncbi:hypothetical protein F2Q69_00022530 [Brassica cretica]|uniref:CCHC-type domain-containing protein n=1 Tax=Brassica cretica TaxID=69181 RepID=A0A8S9QIH6_BRACR|nr:hypothetical protein F2Q69_00022530 [Brassica cretica]